MSNFIQCTTTSGVDIYINPDKIIYVKENTKQKETLIYISKTEYLSVKEPVEKIIGIIDKNTMLDVYRSL